MIALIIFLILLSSTIGIIILTSFIYSLYWIAQFFKQKAITEQQKNKKSKYLNLQSEKEVHTFKKI